VAVAVWFLTVLTSTIITFILPEAFCSVARVRIEPRASQTPSSVAKSGVPLIQNECGVIKSVSVLTNVINTLHLDREWGKKYLGGETMTAAETFRLLKNRVETRPLDQSPFGGKSPLIEIGVYHDDPHEAAKIANTIAEAYQDHHKRGGIQVDLIDMAEPAIRPVRPNKPLNIALGFVIGAAFGALMGGLVSWLGKLSPRVRVEA
jgi:uncharacterized protein involved in exopolysaccharide biosynthesis